MITKEYLKEFIVKEFLSESGVNEIDDDLDLIATGILDSLAVLKIVSFLEMENNITIDPDELDPEKLNSINAIYKLLSNKKPQYADID